jgi:hypothetical protein
MDPAISPRPGDWRLARPDEKTPVVLMAELQDRFHGRMKTAIFGNGFWSQDNLGGLSTILPLAVLPEKDKRSAE